MLKKAFIISFLFIYLISLTEFKQLVKLPLLIQHYIEHKEKDDDLSLIEFLSCHYTHEDDHDDLETKERKLPFKSHEGYVNSIAIAVISNNHTIVSPKAVFFLDKSFLVYTEDFIESSCLSSIWQPPKSC